MSSAWDGLANTEIITQLPHYAINKSLPEDSFFTDRKVARQCYQTFLRVCEEQGIDVGKHVFVEPSAGEGCFLEELPADRRIALDIKPRREEIIEADFLQWYPQDRCRKYVAIGNPPFGVRGAFALAFVKRSLLFADLVAFILPMSFYSNGKGSNMKRVKDAALIHNEELHPYSFYMPGGASVSVKTVFQIWRRGEGRSVFTDYDVSEFMEIYTCCSSPDRYCGLGRGRKYDCFIASSFYGESPGIVKTFDEVLYGSGYGFIIKKDKRKVKKILQQADWSQYCSDATNSCKHIRMYHIRKLLGDNGIGVEKS